MSKLTPYSCKECGKVFMTRRGSYCSDACKMKAYRARKKEMSESHKQTMHMEDRIQLNIAIKTFPEFKDTFKAFESDYGIEPATEMMHIVMSIAGIGMYS